MDKEIYNNWIKLRESTADNRNEKLCYCGHTFKCECSNPDFDTFKSSVANKTIILDDANNGWHPGIDITLVKYKPYKSVTVTGNLAKIYLHKYVYPDGSTSVVIRKYHLNHEEIEVPEYQLIKKYKNLFLYQEFVTLKYDTLMTICATVLKK